MEYVNTANSIFTETVNFVALLSARYSRLLATDTIHLASEVLDHCEKANSIYPSDRIKREHREAHLIEALASLNALDIHLAHVYEILMLNPQGAFTKPSGKTLTSAEAIKKLDSLSQSLGEKIDEERALIKGVLESDKSRMK